MVLAEKGVSTSRVPARSCRGAEVPFDSEYKYMATFHQRPDHDGRPAGTAASSKARPASCWSAQDRSSTTTDDDRWSRPITSGCADASKSWRPTACGR